MREWLTIIIVVLIIGILVDGFRRMRAHRRETLRLSKNMLDSDPLLDEDLTGSEFPSGGARVAGYREATDLENVHQHLKDNYVASKQTRGAPKRPPEQAALNLDSPVPLMNRSEAETDSEEDQDTPFTAAHEPVLGNLDDLDDESTPLPFGKTAGEIPEAMEDTDVEDELPLEKASAPTSVESEETVPQDLQSEADAEPDLEGELSKPRVVRRESSKGDTKSHTAAQSRDQQVEKPEPASEPTPPAMPDEVLVMNIMAKRGEVFLGDDLLQTWLDNGLRFGDMDLFHRHESATGSGPVLFSLANMVKPGTFDLEAMESFETPGISLFLTLPIKTDSLEAYNLMASTAQAMAKTLGGELKDENRSVMTLQTIEHGRQRVIEYERKRRLAKA